MLLIAFAVPLRAGTLTVESNPVGQTPELLGYNLAHFFPGGNAPMWFRYSGVNGARLFMSPSQFGEDFDDDDLAPWGDGVNSLASFEARRSALRASQASTGISGSGPYINWTHFSARYSVIIGGNSSTSKIVPALAFAKLREMGVDILVNISAGPGPLPIETHSDWAGKWELWQHYYAQAYYLAGNYDVCRFQIYNEPDGGSPATANFTATEGYVMRLQLASDAIQCAIADVNSKFGKTLAARVLGPVTVHGHEDYFPSDAENPGWGQIAVAARKDGYSGGNSTWPAILHQYDFHKYGENHKSFLSTIGYLRNYLAADMPNEPAMPISISEFNTSGGRGFESIPETLDSPSHYMAFGAVSSSLIRSGAKEAYCFKFGQTPRSGTSADDEVVSKNGMLFTDNWSAPYNVGGSTKAAEVWRFATKGFKDGRPLLGFTKSADASLDPLEVAISYDAASQSYHILSTNTGNSAVDLSVNSSQWGIPSGGRFLLEELSEDRHGAVRTFGTVATDGFLGDAHGNKTASQPANSTWLFTIPAQARASQTILLSAADSMVSDGAFANSANGTSQSLRIANTSSSNATGRSAALLRFQLPGNVSVSKIQMAVLTLRGSVPAGKTAGRASVHGLPNSSTSWTESGVTWNTAPNLENGVAGGSSIANNFVEGGDVTNLASGNASFLCGHVQANPGATTALQVDVTDFLKSQTDSTREAVFLLTRENRYTSDPVDSEALAIASKEAGTATAPRLTIVLKQESNSNPPTIGAVANQTLHKTVTSDPIAFTVGDKEKSAASLLVTANSSNQSLIPNAGIVLSGLGKNRTLTITPAANRTGTATVTLRVGDGSHFATTSFVVLVTNTTTLPLSAEATVENGGLANADINEAELGCVITKFSNSTTRRKAYFQFDAGTLGIRPGASASFTLGFASTHPQRVQLWALRSAYTGFSSNATWNNALANDTTGNSMLTTGNFTAAPIGESVFLNPNASLDPQTFIIPNISGFVKEGRVTLVLTGLDDPSNSSGGIRFSLNTATLRVPLKATQSINFPAIESRTYGAAPLILNATASSGLRVSYTSSNTAVASVVGSTVTLLAPGTTSITARQAGNSTIAAAGEVSRTLAIAAKPLTISNPKVENKIYNKTTAAVISGNLSGIVPGDTVTFRGAGSFLTANAGTGISVNSLITLSGAAAPKYSIVQPAGLTGAILRKNLVILGLTGGSKVFDGTTSASAQGTPALSGVLAGDIVSLGGSPVFQFANATVGYGKPITASGFTLSGPQASNYSILQSLGFTTGNIIATGAAPIVNPATVSGIFNSPLAFQTVYVGSPTSFSVSSGALPAGLVLNSTSGMISGTPAAAGLSNATVTASNAGGSGSALMAFDIAKANQTLSGLAASFQTSMGSGNYTLGATATSGLPVVYVSSNTSVAAVSGSSISILSAGNSTITAAQPGNANWNKATPMTQSLSVSKGNQTLSFSALAPVVFGVTPFAIRATATSRLPVAYSSSNPAVATIVGNIVTTTGVGNTTLTATQAGNTSYNAAPPTTQTLVVSKRTQTIVFGTIPAKLTTDAPFTLNATTTSGLSLGYASSNLSVATVSGNTVTIIRAGTTNITASQPGDSRTLAAPVVARPLTVRIPLPVVVTGNASSATLLGAILAGEVTSVGPSNLSERGFFVSAGDGFANGTGTKIALTGNFGVGSFTGNTSRLSANTTYYFKAYAVGAGGTAYGLQKSFFTNPEGAPPTFLKPLREGNATVALRWSYSSNSTSFDVEASLSANMSNSSISSGGNETTATFTLGNNTVNFFRVRAVRDATPGPWSLRQAVQVLTLPPSATRYAGLALNPGNLTVSGIFGANNEAGLRAGSTVGNATQVQLLDSNGNATQAIFFNSTTTGWTQGTNNAAGATAIPLGRGFILKNTSGAQSNHIILSGVPFAAAGNITVTPNGAGRYSLFAMARSNPAGLSALNLTAGAFLPGTSLAASDSLQIHDASGARTVWYHSSEARWYLNGSPTLSDPIIPAGAGLLFRQAPGSTWSAWRIPTE